MDDVARLPSSDRSDLFTTSAARRGISPIIVEKDFWVCWTLRRVFALQNPPASLVFKGGTSLSKVWGVIDRFSEDVDLSFNRDQLGFGGKSEKFPGFDTDIHGLVEEANGKRKYYVDCVRGI
jgi:predicted nucleotidyltransferase component of viral defense system